MEKIEIPSHSVLYNYVRCRQLDRTYDDDPMTGTWCVTSSRIYRGWGFVAEEDFPYIKSVDEWPPTEPPGLDEKAKKNRCWYYRRLKTVEQGIDCIRRLHPFVAGFRITKQWFKAKNGVIKMPSPKAKIVGGHAVCIDGFDMGEGVFHFVNSWGGDWGKEGRGVLPFEYFEQYCVDATSMDMIGKRTNIPLQDKSPQYLNWGRPDFMGDYLHGVDVYDHETDTRIGWAFLIEKASHLEVEELFVRPEYRGKGHGSSLVTMIAELRDERKKPLRITIPWADATDDPARLGKLFHLANKLGLYLSAGTTNFDFLEGVPGPNNTPGKETPKPLSANFKLWPLSSEFKNAIDEEG